MGVSGTVDALCQAAEAAQRADNFRDLERLSRELIGACNAAGDPRVALGYQFLGICYGRKNDASRARENYVKALELFRSAGDRRGVLRVTVGLAYIAGELEVDPDAAHRLSEEALAIARELGDPEYLAVTTGNFAEVCRAQGDYASALRLAAEAAALYSADERWGRAAAQYSARAHIFAVRSEFSESAENLRLAWELLQRQPIAIHIAWYFEVAFIIAALRQSWETAARLYGFVDHYRDVNDAPRLQGILPRLSAQVERVYAELGHERVDELLHEGERLSLEQAQALTQTFAESSAAPP